MAKRGTQEMLLRQWRLVRALAATRRGRTPTQLATDLGASRSTLYRDLALLQRAGVPIATERVNGESRYRLLGERLPPLAPTALQHAALRLAREALAPLRGSSIVRELDALLTPAHASSAIPPVRVGRLPSADSSPVLATIERSMERRRRLRILYHSASSGQTRWRTVDPLELRLVGSQAYLVVWDLEADAIRKLKLPRVKSVEELPERAERHDVDVDAELAHSVKMWSGDPVEVAIRLSPEVGWLAREWPLVEGQTVDLAEDGSVVVRARVSGIVETLRWVLGWGAAAEALEPPALRDAVRSELATALGRYGRRGPAKAKQVVSPIVRQRGVRK